MDLKDLVIKKLKLLIKERFKTQKIFAKEVGVGEGTVTFWLQKKASITLESIEKIANACKIDPSYFFTDDSQSNVIDADIFNEVFNLAYELAIKNNLKINGTYFLGCYELVVEKMQKEQLNVEDSFKSIQPIVLKLAK